MSSHRPDDRELEPEVAERRSGTGDQVTPPGTPVDAPVAEPRETVPARPPRTRLGAAFNGFTIGAVMLLLLLIFILENTRSVKISFLGANGHVPLGVALLLSAVVGALIVAVVGVARIAQIRRHATRRARGR